MVNLGKVCKPWRDVARLAWTIRKTICIHGQELANKKSVPFDMKKLEENAINKFVFAKSIGHSLTLFHLVFDDSTSMEGLKRVSLTALAQNCINLEYIDLR